MDTKWSDSHNGLVHKSIALKGERKNQDAKAAVNKEWNKLKKTTRLGIRESQTQVRSSSKSEEGRKILFITLRDLCSTAMQNTRHGHSDAKNGPDLHGRKSQRSLSSDGSRPTYHANISNILALRADTP